MSISYHKITPYAQQFADNIKQVCQGFGVDIDDTQLTQLLKYLDNLLLWNKAYNLTAIDNPKEALIKHIFDCLAILPTFGKAYPNQINNVLDIGTGAGLPAVILAIMRPDWQITALDSNSKKIRFIRQMVGELGLKNLHPVASRIEEFDDKFDVITSRAFASLSDFVAVGQACLADDGVFCAMKGKAPSADELAQLPQWHIVVDDLSVPQLDGERCLVHLSQIS